MLAAYIVGFVIGPNVIFSEEPTATATLIPLVVPSPYTSIVFKLGIDLHSI